MESLSTRAPDPEKPDTGGKLDTHEVLEGQVAAVLYQDEDSGFAVVRLDTAAGPAESAGNLAPVADGESLRIHGRWSQHPRFGRRFKADWSERFTPATLEGIRRYLAGGAFHGIGPDIAGRLVDHFGDRSLEALEAGERRLREVPGIGRKRAAALAAAFRENRDRHRLLAELRGLGLSPGQAAEAYRRWSAGAVERVRRDPYALVGELAGIGFHTAETLAAACGIARDSAARARGVLLHLLREAAREGHACLPFDPLMERVQELGIPSEVAAATVSNLAGDGRAVRESGDEGEWLYLSGLWSAESGIAAEVERLLGAGEGGPLAETRLETAARRLRFTPDAHQRTAIETAWRAPLAVLTGGPGTGKTTVLRLLLDLLETGGFPTIKLASPTGRAAKRLQEATGRKAATIHRLLGFDPRTMRFQHDADNPLEADYLVVDEVSMLDLPLAHALFQAVPDGCRLLLVGDADQLPSVGPGTVLRDLVAAPRIPTVRLLQIHRQQQGSSIVEAAHAVISGRMPRSSPSAAAGDFFISFRDDPDAAAEMVERLVCERIPRRFGFDPMEDVLVLSPMYKGPLGVDALNERLSRRLNPQGSGAAWSRPFRSGDRVMITRNDYERETFNGDLGKVEAVDGREMLVRVGARLHAYRPGQLGDLVLSYCVTVHRAQGAEARAVVVVLDRSQWLMLRRNLLYTALTRARDLAVLVTQQRTLRRAVTNSTESRRYGRLAERLGTPLHHLEADPEAGL